MQNVLLLRLTLHSWMTKKHKGNGTKGKPLESLTRGGEMQPKWKVFLSSNAFILLSNLFFLFEIVIFEWNA